MSLTEFKKSLKDMYDCLVEDAKKIIEQIENYKKSPLTNKTSLSGFNAFDYVTPFDCDLQKNSTIAAVKQAYNDLYSTGGVYIFLMTKDYNVTSDFNHVNYGAQLKNANSKNTLYTGEILYIGKAEKFLGRMHQHFHIDNNRTGSLKLLAEPRKGLIGNFTIYAFQVKKKYKQYMQPIIATVEKYLHKNLEYLVGNK